MSLKPFTSLAVNQRGVDVLGKQPDVVYMLAPALRGGEKRDDDGNVIYDKNGLPVFIASEPFNSLAAFEIEYGLASNGSPASIYAKWLYDHGNFAVRCFRTASEDLSFATGVLYDKFASPVLRVKSATREADANLIRVDVDVSSGIELYLGIRNVYYDVIAQKFVVITVYEHSDILSFEGQIGTQPITIDVYGDALHYEYGAIGDDLQAELRLFDWTEIVSVSDDAGQVYTFLGVEVPLEADGCIYNSATKRLIFNESLAGRWVSVTVRLASGDFVVYRAKSDLSFVDMAFEQFEFFAAYLNGVGQVNDITQTKLLRLYNESAPIPIVVSFFEVAGVKQLYITDNEDFFETYEYVTEEQVVAAINLSSRLVAAEAVSNLDKVPDFVTDKPLQPIGFRLTAYNGTYVDTYDNLRSVGEAVANIQTGLIRVEALSGAHVVPANSIGLQLEGGSSGLEPVMTDYLAGIEAARSLNDVTVIVAPGVADETLHNMLGEHCREMFTYGKHVMAFGGVALGESMDDKIKRTTVMENERFVLVGDGLQLQDPVSGIKKMFSGSIAVMAVIGQMLGQKYYESLTNKKIRNAYGLEHYYNDAELNVLHEARLVVFEFDAGVKIVDGITTSTKNAFEDVHMIRVFDVISRSLQVIMRNSTGEANLPPTWSFVIGKMRKMLTGLVDVGALLDFKILNEVRPEDLVAKRYRVRVGVIPVFPVKYIEGFIDIIPPTFVEV